MDTRDPQLDEVCEDFSRIEWSGPVFITELMAAGEATHYLIREEDRSKLPTLNGLKASGLRTLPEDSAAASILTQAFYAVKPVYVSTDIRRWWISQNQFVWRATNAKVTSIPV